MSQLYVNKELLIKLNNRAIRRNSNITQALPHNDVEMRVCFATHEGKQMWLDISFKEYDSLPQLDLATNNDVQ